MMYVPNKKRTTLSQSKRLALSSSRGFTLTELLLAMAVFSMVMMIATVGFIGMNRLYVRGTIKKGLSEGVQLVNDDMTKVIRAAGNIPGGAACSPNPTGFDGGNMQIAGVTYAWKSSGGLWRGPADCTAPATSFNTEILSDTYTVRELSVTKVLGEDYLYTVQGVFTAGDDNGLRGPTGSENWYDHGRCKGTTEAPESRGCSVEKFRFTVNGRAQN